MSRRVGIVTLFLAVVLSATAPAASSSPHSSPPPPPQDSHGFSFDFPGVEVGVAEYEQGPTGATVFYFPEPVMGAVDVRGGSPGTMNTDGLRLAHETPWVNAITIAGGSAYGLSVATGVAQALKDAMPDSASWEHRVHVVSAVIFDLGDRRYTAVTPDEALGRAALKNIRAGWFPLGARGAGRMAMQGSFYGDWQHSGQGAAMRQSGAVKALVFTVVNAYGSVVDREGHVQRCAHPINDDCGPITRRISEYLSTLHPVQVADGGTAEESGGTTNTTITLVVTNQKMPFWALQRLAVQVHNSMGRAIQPFGTQYDGDTLFAVSTGELKSDGLSNEDLSTLASEAAWDAVLASVPPLPPAGPTSTLALPPTALDAYVGRYEFAPGAVADVRRGLGGLEVQATGRNSVYLPAGRWIGLRPVAQDEFVLATDRADRLHLDRDAQGRIVGLTIDPGPWPMHARRVAPAPK